MVEHTGFSPYSQMDDLSVSSSSAGLAGATSAKTSPAKAMYMIEETKEANMDHIYNADAIAEPQGNTSSSDDESSMISTETDSFELMKMRVEASEAIAKAAQAESVVAKAVSGVVEAKLKLFEAQERAERLSQKSRSSRGKL